MEFTAMDRLNQKQENDTHLLRMLDRGIDDMEAKRELPLEDAFRKITELRDITILMVTHDPYAASYTDRILYFKDGHIISELKRCNRARQDFYEEIMLEAARQDKQR